MPITSLYVTHVGPFDEITVEFDPKVNVFIGPNNSGKSTLLWVLAELLVYPFTMPSRLLRSEQAVWRLNISSSTDIDSINGVLPTEPAKFVNVYEKIGHTCYVPAQRQSTNFRSPGPTLNQNMDSRLDEELATFFPDIHPSFRLRGREAIRQALRSTIDRGEPTELARRRKLMLVGTSLVNDRAVKQKIVDLDYAAHRRNNPDIKSTIVKVVSIASEITEGFPIEYLEVAEGSEGLFPQLRTQDGDLPLDVLSQGTQSIIQFLAHLVFGYAEYYDFPPDLEKKQGILIIDEIDAHLHPTWQRRIIPTLTKHFPNLQIFCSTHSPLMLASLKAGQVQLLNREDNGKVRVSQNESDIAGWTADEILRQFMDVPNPTDLETAERISRFQELMSMSIEERSSAQSDELEQLRHLVRDDLLSGPNSAQVIRFAEELKASGSKSSLPHTGSPTNQETSRE